MRRLLPLLLAGFLLALPAQAAAQSRVFKDYRNHGTINPCSYSPSELKHALSGLPPDVEAYVPGLGDSLRRGCSSGSPGAAPTQAQQSAVVPQGPSSGSSPPPGGAAAAAKRAVPQPPAPHVAVRDVVAGTAPKVPDGPLPDIPAWVAALLAAGLAGILTTLVAVRYGALDPSGIARSVRAALTRR